MVVYCTGYRVTFPFLTDEVVRSEDNHVDLYRRVAHPEHPGLYFIGLIQPLGAIMPLAEAQAEWVGDLVTGVGVLPPPAEMRAQIAAYDQSLRQRYVASKRHTIEVDFRPYRVELAKERKARAPPPPRLASLPPTGQKWSLLHRRPGRNGDHGVVRPTRIARWVLPAQPEVPGRGTKSQA